MAAKLDYAFLSEFARIDQGGLLNAVGASFERVLAPVVPTNQSIAIVLRILFPEGEEQSAQLELAIHGPERSIDITFGGDVSPAAGARPLAGYAQAFAIITPVVPLPAYGVYTVEARLDGQLARTMWFEVAQPADV